MKSYEVIQALKSSVAITKASGAKSISIDDLEAYTLKLEETVKKTPDNVAAGEAAMEAYKADLNAWASSRQQKHEFNIEMLKATVATGQSALKSALLINGGAAIAILAFIGKIWSQDNDIPACISISLACYVFGVLSAASASGFTYLSQAGYGKEFGKYSYHIGTIGRFIAIICVILAYILFGAASWLSYLAISNY